MTAVLEFPWAQPPAFGEAIEVAPDILWLRAPLPMRLDHVNIYALRDADGWTVVDTGFDSARLRQMWQGMLDGPLLGLPVVRVLVTHYHPDHIGLAGWLMARGAELWTTRTSWLLARMLILDEQPLPVPETIAYWTRAGMPPEMVAERAAQRPFNFADVVHPLPLGYRRITEGEVLRLAGRDWVVRMGNGHAPEHATLWSETDGLVIGGDQLLPGISPNLGVYATEPDADPVGEWLESCHRFAGFAKAGQLVLPGHNTPFRNLPLRLAQLIDNHAGALARLETRLAESPATAADCFVALFRRPIAGAEYGLALAEAVAHVNHLVRAGRIALAGHSPAGGALWATVTRSEEVTAAPAWAI